jgi:hypothetical protein
MPRSIIQNDQIFTAYLNQLNNYDVVFAGSDPIGSTTPALNIIGDTALNTVSVVGSDLAQHHGSIQMGKVVSLTVSNGVHLSNGTLSVNESPVDQFALNGNSTLDSNSTLTVGGFSGAGAARVNGAVWLQSGSTVDMESDVVTGAGKINLTGANTLARLGSVGSDIVVNLNMGVLALKDGMHFLGTIHEQASTETQVFNAMSAVKEVFTQSSDVLDLVDAQGANVAVIGFGAGAAPLYATPDAATGAVDITRTQQAGSLPVIFPHG